jgi:D-alanyl-D-alanine carboxypeptidase
MPFSTGEAFAGFGIVRLLGSGGMGEVYLAEHPRVPRRGALKVLAADVSGDPGYRARFDHEADLVSNLRHPRIVTRIAGLATCVALVMVGCSSTPGPTMTTVGSGTTTATGSVPTPSALKPIDPAAFQTVVDAAAKKLLVPGAMVVLRTPHGSFDAVVGTTKVGAQTPPDASTHFRIASNTKTMTAALIVLLAEDGKLKFSDPVSTYVPGVPNGENITIAELLKMRSGLYNYTNAPEFAAALDADPTKVWTPQEVLAVAFRHPPDFPPDTA